MPKGVTVPEMIKAGYVGFEGLTDLPGTIAGAVYGNSGCRHCSINELVTDIELLTDDGIKLSMLMILNYHIEVQL